eukprot:350391_1
MVCSDIDIESDYEVSNDKFDMHRINPNTIKIKNKNLSKDKLLWNSSNNESWNELFDTLCNLLPNATQRDAATIESKLSILESLKSNTLTNCVVLSEIVSLHKNIPESKLKDQILNDLPTKIISLPVFNHFKKPQILKYCTLKNFPDDNPLQHWINIATFINDYIDKILKNHNLEKQQMSQLFKQQLQKAEYTNNREAVVLIKQIMEELFDASTINHVIKVRKNSEFRVEAYNTARDKLIDLVDAENIATERYNKRLLNKQNELKLLNSKNEYEVDYSDTIRESRIIRRKKLETKIKELEEKVDKKKRKTTQNILRKNKKFVLNLTNRLYDAKGRNIICSEDYQRFMDLCCKASKNQHNDQLEEAHPRRRNMAGIIGKSTAIAENMVTVNNVYAAYRERGVTDPNEAYQDYYDKTPQERREFLQNSTFTKGISSKALVYLYGKDKDKNKNVPKHVLGLWQFSAIDKSIVGPDHLNKDVGRQTFKELQTWILIQPENHKKKSITVSSDDCSGQRHDHITTNNCRTNQFLISLKDPNETDSSIRRRLGYKSSEAPKDKGFLYIQASSYVALLGTVICNENGDVSEFNRVGRKQVNLLVVGPKMLHKGTNADSRSIWLYLSLRDHGVGANKHLLDWSDDTWIEFPKYFKRDLLNYITLIRNGSIVLKFAKESIKYLSSDIYKQHFNVILLYFILIYYAHNSIVIGRIMKVLFDKNEHLKHGDSNKYNTCMLFSEQVSILQSASLNLLYMLNIKESDLFEVDYFLFETFETTYREKFIMFDVDKIKR